MNRKPERKDGSKKRLDPAIIVALIGLAGTIIAALLASPLLEKWFSASPPATDTAVPASTGSGVTPLTSGNRIGLNQTVQGTLYFDEAGVWILPMDPPRSRLFWTPVRMEARSSS